MENEIVERKVDKYNPIPVKRFKKRGRPSLIDEKARIESLERIFFSKWNVEKIRRKVLRKKYSMFDMLIYQALAGNDKILLEIFKRLFPEAKAVQPDQWVAILNQFKELVKGEPSTIKEQTLLLFKQTTNNNDNANVG